MNPRRTTAAHGISRVVAVALPLALLLACRSTSSPHVAAHAQPPPLASVPALRAHIRELIDDPAVSRATWGLEVRSLSAGDTLVAIDAHKLLMPASTLKTVTLAVAAEQLGWNFSYDTSVFSNGPISNGTLDGDLVVVGSGDPSLDDWDGAASGVFASWATQLKALGVSRVNGRVIGNDHVFTDTGLGQGWMWDDVAYAYSATASGLQFNQGSARIVVAPGGIVGAPAMLGVVPAYAPLRFTSAVKTATAGSSASINFLPMPRSDVVDVTGSVAVDGGQHARTIAVLNPTQYFVNAVRAGLTDSGIDVRGAAVDADELPDAPVADGRAPLLTHRSEPLSSLADTMMKLSQNLYAETLLRTVGHAGSGVGSAEAGLTVVRDRLAQWGVAASDVVLVDGSGLSRYDLITADALVSVLTHVYGDVTLRDPFLASLPVAGRAGTLETRMRGTAAEGNALAKTGSFTNARAVAGFVRTRDGEPLAFSIVANNYGMPAASVDRITDAVVVALAEFHR